MMKIILTSWTPQKNLNSCLPGFPRPTLNAMRLGKAYEPFGQGEALIEVVRKRNKKGEIELSPPLLGNFTKSPGRMCHSGQMPNKRWLLWKDKLKYTFMIN